MSDFANEFEEAIGKLITMVVESLVNDHIDSYEVESIIEDKVEHVAQNWLESDAEPLIEEMVDRKIDSEFDDRDVDSISPYCEALRKTLTLVDARLTVIENVLRGAFKDL
ncbi:MAG: hypothetical protein AMS18_00220 [Gemmatimonas sp. SG8_17]|nr:MAG: hypothetical protein AMS18_00220 [Gemmatimonas sp. SG8_17]